MDLKAVGPLIAPLLQEAFDQIVFPAISAKVAEISQPDAQTILNDFLPALKKAVDDEIAKLK